jgi:hypothetical protein
MKASMTMLGAMLLLGACTSPAAQTPPALTSCEAAAVYYKDQMGQPLGGAVSFKPQRVIKPGSAVTMDFNSERLNVYTDENGLIINARCG